MEIRVTGKRLGGAAVQTAVKKEGAPDKAAAGGKPRQDRVELSRQAVGYLKEQAGQLAEQIARIGQEDEKEQSGESSMFDFLEKELDVMDKCNRISASISKGDNVPPEDLRYLQKHDIHAYLLALATRKPKEDPEEKDSVLSEEDMAQEEAADQLSSSSGAQAAGAGAEGDGAV